MRLIDADALIYDLEIFINSLPSDFLDKFEEGCRAATLLAIAKAYESPTVDLVKRGEWIEIQYGVLVCSECKKQSLKFNYYKNNIKTKFCPHCGARMDGEENAAD